MRKIYIEFLESDLKSISNVLYHYGLDLQSFSANSDCPSAIHHFYENLIDKVCNIQCRINKITENIDNPENSDFLPFSDCNDDLYYKF